MKIMKMQGIKAFLVAGVMVAAIDLLLYFLGFKFIKIQSIIFLLSIAGIPLLLDALGFKLRGLQRATLSSLILSIFLFINTFLNISLQEVLEKSHHIGALLLFYGLPAAVLLTSGILFFVDYKKQK